MLESGRERYEKVWANNIFEVKMLTNIIKHTQRCLQTFHYILDKTNILVQFVVVSYEKLIHCYMLSYVTNRVNMPTDFF